MKDTNEICKQKAYFKQNYNQQSNKEENFCLPAARIEVRAFNWQMIPALAIDKVCCSITSWRTERVESFILSNSSMQQIPLSAKTSAPVNHQIDQN